MSESTGNDLKDDDSNNSPLFEFQQFCSIYDSIDESFEFNTLELDKFLSSKEIHKKIKDKKEQMIDKIQEKLQSYNFIKFRHKFGFVFGVITFLAAAYLFGKNMIIYNKFYCIVYGTLLVIRFYTYSKQKVILFICFINIKNQIKFQLFLIDFCYLTNYLVLYFLLFNNQSINLFRIIYATTNGMLFLAVPLFRNSLVFHSLDRITSCILHILPGLVCYRIRWADKNPLWPSEKNILDISQDFNKPFYSKVLLHQLFLHACLVYLIWCIFYYVFIFMIVKKKPNSDQYMTSFDYLTQDKKIQNILNSFGRKNQGYVLIQIY